MRLIIVKGTFLRKSALLDTDLNFKSLTHIEECCAHANSEQFSKLHVIPATSRTRFFSIRQWFIRK